ncbi:DDRGK domain-containing protein 1 [Phlebotomus argentipes]|uniref:DDRGK domain-containing protein 1 n=1 Tax=Phlebotomus argentipes TaxID=94469 RepID=UPI0028930C98|nr:DDRGK domain-containing protein 1 [Phlebotomus argentipes]
MDLNLLIGIAGSLLVILLTTLYFLNKGKTEKKDPGNQAPARRGVPVRVQEGIPRRAQLARNQRNRLRQANVAEEEPEDDDVEDEAAGEATSERPMPDFAGEKMGAKKRAKLEAKAEKKAQREAELRVREERKKKDAVLEEERRKADEKEREEERAREEAEKRAQEERERREHEEYLKLKATFDVEEEGFEEGEDQENLLRDFVEYIERNKVVVLEDLATQFKLKTQAVIDRITDLKAEGTLTGVIDDRGKFIFISESELKAVAKFIRQRGRVSIAELAECSNTLINLVPVS